MVARVTLAEVDVLRTRLDAAVARFEELVVPVLEEQPGFEGVYVLTTPEGKALVLSLWADEESAAHGVESGFWAAQVEKFVTVFRAPPGRETYDVAVAELPASAAF